MTARKAQAPFRYDIVGSFLRPQALKEKRAAFARGEIDATALRTAEDEAIRHLVAQEKAAGRRDGRRAAPPLLASGLPRGA